MFISLSPPGFYATSHYIYFVNQKHEVWILTGAGKIPRKVREVPIEAEMMPTELTIDIKIPECVK